MPNLFNSLTEGKYSGDINISRRMFNNVVGGLLLYGFFMNFMITALFVNIIAYIPTLLLIIGYLVCVVVGSILIKNTNSPVISFIAYNLIVLPVGVLLATILPYYYFATILMALILTAIVTVVMMILSNIKPEWFISVGKIIPFVLLFTIVIEIIMLLLGFDLMIMDFIVLTIFSLYIGYDWVRMNAMPTTVCAAFDAATEIYLDLINIFIRLLRILSKSDD